MMNSQKGCHALQAFTSLPHRFEGKNPAKIYEIATGDGLPEKFLEFIPLKVKQARISRSVRGTKGGDRLKRQPSENFLDEIIRTIHGPLAPLEDAEPLRRHVNEGSEHRALFQVLLSVRNAAAGILDRTSLADLCH